MSTANQESGDGVLLIVGTPIGNLGDLSPRGATALITANAIICEDSRRTGKLLVHAREVLGDDPTWQRPPLLVANEHTEYERVPEIVDRLQAGEAVALVTDAGMPMVSDPGSQVVAAAVAADVRVEVVPGPTAISAALAVSGLPTERFVFEGFLPRKGRERSDRLAVVADEPRTIVFYEAPHRVCRTLVDLGGVCGPDRPVSVVRELTKLYEQAHRSTLGEAAVYFEDHEPKGEFVIVVGGHVPEQVSYDNESIGALLKSELAGGSSTRDAVGAVVALTGLPKRKIYSIATSLDAADQPDDDRKHEETL